MIIGDRVKVKNEYLGEVSLNIKNLEGTVVIVHSSSFSEDLSIGVKFDKEMGGHDLDGECDDGYGYWLYEEQLELVKDEYYPF